MTREEAIEYWEGLRKTFFSQLEKEENHLGRMHLQTTIDVLDTTISALRAQQEQESKPLDGWISVKDRLPETDGNYIVCDRRINGKPWIHEAGFRKASSSWYELHGLYYDGFGRYGEQDKFTHWQPMPEPPEGE